jgi:putative acetyltransferase
MSDIGYRNEAEADHAAVETIVSAAFGRRDEARIVDRLRGTPAAVLSMVADRSGEIVGHVLFSRVSIVPSSGADACALGPVAVQPAEQSAGIGSALIRAALDRVAPDFDLIFVLGNPRYYSRFGFQLAAPHGYHYVSSEFDRAFQVRGGRGALVRTVDAWVRYHPAFAD